jgi:ribosomal protein L37E
MERGRQGPSAIHCPRCDARAWLEDGTVTCSHCGLARPHQLEGHAQLWYRVEVDGRALFAERREELVRILHHLRTPGAKDFYLRACPCCRVGRLPAHFQTKRNRHLTIRAIERFLGL